MGFLLQSWTLTKKDLMILVRRRWLSTFLRAVALPIAYMFFIAYVRNFFLPPSEYGFGFPRPVRNLTTEVFGSDLGLGGRDRVVFIHNSFRGGQVEDLIDILAPPLEQAGADVRIAASDDELFEVCRSSLRGLSRCYAAATFHSSPTEGPGGVWSYTARADFALGYSVWVDRPTNDAQVYVLPFVHAIDSGIATLSSTTFPEAGAMLEYPFTRQTIQERDDEIQIFFMRALVRYLAVTLFIGISGVLFHLPGYVATERELGMSTLIDAMIPSSSPWQGVMARLCSTYGSFVATYIPGWVAIGIIVSLLIFNRTASSIVVTFHILTGLSLTAYSAFGASLFRRAQLSGITVLLVSLVLAIISQFLPQTTTSITALSVIFPPVTYTSFTIYLAGFEENLEPANLSYAAPDSSMRISGYVYFVCLVAQLVVYSMLSVFVQWFFYSTSQQSRKQLDAGSTAFQISNVSKHFVPTRLHRVLSTAGLSSRSEVVKAVDQVSLSALRGNIVVLLGANGAGKSTMLSMMAGTSSVTAGRIETEKAASIGLCPQHNVLWHELTVREHVRIFNGLKARGKTDSKAALDDLITACDLSEKPAAKAATLSGGQKRKLQLAMAFTGGSEICCIDEVSSGLDPLSRRIIWQILLSERGRRTILMTTHALDEADALSDQVAIMSKGSIVAEGSTVELKHRYGSGYKITVAQSNLDLTMPDAAMTLEEGNKIIHAADSAKACELAAFLQKQGVQKLDVSGPTIENVFLALAEEYEEELEAHESSTTVSSKSPSPTESETPLEYNQVGPSFGLVQGRGTTFMMQVWILLRKRLLILTRNYLPYCFAIIVPVITAGLTIMFLGGFDRLICSPSQLANNPRRITLPAVDYYWGVLVPAGPPEKIVPSQIPQSYYRYRDRVQIQNSLEDFQAFTEANFRDVMPGGFYLGDNGTAAPLLSYRIDGGLGYAGLAKNIIDSILLNTTIVVDFSTFALPLIGATGDSLQLVLYFGFAMCAYPAFFALYPAFERIGNIRALHYSNGVRPGPLWLSYTIFDSVFVVIVSVLTVVVFTSLANVWYAPGYLFVVFLLYGIASTLLSYIVSLFATTQLAAFAFAAGGQAVFLLLYFIMYMVLITFTQPDQLYPSLNTVQFVYGLFTPSGNLLRALLLTLNQSQLLCRNQEYVSYPGEITVYGGPILYLVLQIFAFYYFLVAYDSGWQPRMEWFRRKRGTPLHDSEKEADNSEDTVSAEVRRVEHSNDGLRVLHLTKRFGANTAVADVTFGIKQNEILALLGRNGAGKSTTFDVIRGKTRPSSSESQVRIENILVHQGRTAASRLLGVCPQFEGFDRMTVSEHLAFYARARGVPEVNTNVKEVIRAVGLAPFQHRMAAKLSGGNQRKLSLGTAIIGNPSVLLLDEPSSGMDAVAKRIMWRVISRISSGRSTVLTTHSMEEASALANRAAILSKKMLAIGDVKTLSETYGEGLYHVQLFHRHGAAVTDGDAVAIHEWVELNFSGVHWTSTMLHGQFRFAVRGPRSGHGSQLSHTLTKDGSSSGPPDRGSGSEHTIQLLQILEANKETLGIEHYSVSETTLEDVFLTIMGRNRGLEVYK